MAARKQITDEEGNVYKGEVVDGLRHGYGTIVYSKTKDVYQGEFENDVPHGAGKYIRAGGERDGTFEGLWIDGVVEKVKKGRAKVIEDNGDVYEGGFHHWKRHGHGILQKSNGEIYNGQFQDGLYNGPGIIRYPNGKSFEGLFRDGKPENSQHRGSSRKIDNENEVDLNPYKDKGKRIGGIPRVISFTPGPNNESGDEALDMEYENRYSSRMRSSRSSSRNDRNTDSIQHERIPTNRMATERIALSHQTSYSDVDPDEFKKIDKLIDQQNLRKFDQNRSTPLDENEPKKTGMFSFLRGRSKTPQRVKKETGLNEKSPIHARPAPRPQSVCRYVDAPIEPRRTQSRSHQQSSSRPRVRGDKVDYEPTTNYQNNINHSRSRSTSRSRAKIDDYNHDSHKHSRMRERSQSRPRGQRSENENIRSIKKIYDNKTRSASRSRSYQIKINNDDWHPSRSLKLDLPPASPKRSASSNRRSEKRESSNERPYSHRRTSSRISSSHQRERSSSREHRSEGEHGTRSSHERPYSVNKERGEKLPPSYHRNRSSSRRRSTSRGGTTALLSERTKMRHNGGRENEIMNKSSRHYQDSFKDDPHHSARSLSNKGKSGTRALYNGGSDNIYFVE